MLLIAPRRIQRRKLVPQRPGAVTQLVIEFLQALGKLPELFRIDNGLRHDHLAEK
jgi:hypothetical protein